MTKTLVSITPITYNAKSKKPKYCTTCDSLATVEATFDVGEGVRTSEKYCDECSKQISARGPQNSTL